MSINHAALDAWITGNWGEDYLSEPEDRVTCWDCRDEFPRREMEQITNPKGRPEDAYLCEDCVEKWTCAGCGKVIYGDEAITRTGYCDSCVLDVIDLGNVFERGAA
jgi:hypothetical protein